jgi:hypothetical protein
MADILSYPQSATATDMRRYAVPFGLASVLFIILANGGLAAFVINELWSVPPNTEIVPMALAVVSAFVCAGIMGTGITLAGITIFLGRRNPRGWLLGLICLAFACIPFQVLRFAVRFVCHTHNLTTGG